jgi:hypothetical protein
MPWVRFTADFDWYPPERRGHWCKAYKAGTVDLVTSPCAAAAIAAGKVERCDKPKDKTNGRR